MLTAHHRVTPIALKRYNLDGAKRFLSRFKLTLDTGHAPPPSGEGEGVGKPGPVTSRPMAYFSGLEAERVEALHVTIAQSLKTLR